MKRTIGKTQGGIFWVKTHGIKKWGIDYRDPVTRKRRRLLIGTREQAISKRNEIRLEAKGLKPKQVEILFEDGVKQYLRHRAAEGKGDRSYRFLKKGWPELFRGRKIGSISSEEIEEQLAVWTEARGWKPATRNQALAQLSGFFSYAYGRQWIDVHPTDKGRVPRLSTDNARTRWLRLHEVEAIVANSPDWLKPIIGVAVKTGMRLGEICTLRRSSFEIDELDQAYLVVEKTKNKERLYWPVEGGLRQTVEKAVERATFPGSYLFPGPEGGCAMTSIHRTFPKVVQKAGLKYGRDEKDGVTFHTMRHHAESRIMRSRVLRAPNSAENPADLGLSVAPHSA